jgi:cell division transport system ATP-binding protein
MVTIENPSAADLVEELLAEQRRNREQDAEVIAATAAAESAAMTEATADSVIDADDDSSAYAVPYAADEMNLSGKQATVASLPKVEAPRATAVGKPVIFFDKVSKVYTAQPNKPALANISLSIFAGEFVFLVGHSGSGKSTFIRLIDREIRATTGKLTVAGEDLTHMRNWRIPYLRRNIGCVFQDYKLLPNKSAFDNVAFALEVIGKSRHIIRTQVPEVLRLVGLEDKLEKLPDQLSGGEQQRVSIARAIVNRPPLLICDEPTGNLDPQTSLGIMRLLDRINRTGTTVLIATHDREMVDSLRKRVIALENGYLVRDQDRGVYGIDA